MLAQQRLKRLLSNDQFSVDEEFGAERLGQKLG
jgi:hypothetical protein